MLRERSKSSTLVNWGHKFKLQIHRQRENIVCFGMGERSFGTSNPWIWVLPFISSSYNLSGVCPGIAKLCKAGWQQLKSSYGIVPRPFQHSRTALSNSIGRDRKAIWLETMSTFTEEVCKVSEAWYEDSRNHLAERLLVFSRLLHWAHMKITSCHARNNLSKMSSYGCK